MKTNVVTVVVDDKFSEFATLEGVTTVSKLANLFDGLHPTQDTPQVVLFGQGVSESWSSYLKNRAEARGYQTQFLGQQQISERTGRKFCHKWNRHNVLITDPKLIEENRYSMQLSIDDACEIMSDHVSGYHVQGMVFVEAARQVFLAVTECYFLPKGEKYYFVINKLNTSYHKFAFPLPTEIQFELIESDNSREGRFSAKGVIRFWQCGECVSETTVEYAAILEEQLSGKERKMAVSALGQTLSKVDTAALGSELVA